MPILSVASVYLSIIIAEVIATNETHAASAAPCVARTRDGITHIEPEPFCHRAHRHDSAGSLVP